MGILRDTVVRVDNTTPLPVRNIAEKTLYYYRHNNLLNRARRYRDYSRLAVESRTWDEPRKLHLGCGEEYKSGFINSDIFQSPAAEYVLDATNLPVPQGSIERIETYHVVEHLPKPVFQQALKEWHRVLSPTGTLVMELPDFDACVKEYLDTNDRERQNLLLEFVYGAQRHKTDVHFWGWNEERLRNKLRDVGFQDVKREEPKQTKNPAPCLRMVGKGTK